jgi:hypothetical protein
VVFSGDMVFFSPSPSCSPSPSPSSSFAPCLHCSAT